MKSLLKSTAIRIALATAAGLFVPAISSCAQSASATISAIAAGSGYDYTITLYNSGPSSLNGFWYGWTLYGNNLPSIPANADNSLGWDNTVYGNSIMWENNYGTTLGNGGVGTFTFFSTSTPSAMTTPPHGESVAYVGGIDFSQGSDGYSTAVFSPTLVTAPEPSSIGLLAIGSLGLLASARRKIRGRS